MRNRLFTVLFTFLILSGLTVAQDFSSSNSNNNVASDEITGSTVLQWDDGINFTGVGLTAGGTFEVAARFPASLTGPLTGDDLTQVEIYIDDLPTSAMLKIYDQGTATTPGTVLHSEDITSQLMADSWILLTLSTPLTLSGDDIWVSYEVTHDPGLFPCGADAGPAVVDGDWLYDGSTWQRLSVLGLNYNWNIHAIVEDGGSGGTTFFDDFDSYIAGQDLACQNPVDWDTWSNNPCGPDDALVSDAFAYSGANSVLVVANDDLIKPLGDLTTGKWYMSFKFYIPATKSGYFNTMNEFNGVPQVWGMDSYFDVGGAGRLDTTGGGGVPANTVNFTYVNDVWNQVVVIVDLDNQMAEYWVGTTDPLTMIASWDWTQGGTKPNQLSVNDFFGAAPTDEMYFDDYWFSDQPPTILPVELTSFAASVTSEGHVALNWSTATEINNQMFEVERKAQDGQFVKIGFVNGHGTTTEPQEYSFVDNSVQPGIYSYRLKQIDYQGTYEYSPVVEVDVHPPLAFGLEQNYPNPFNPSTNIKFSVAEQTLVKLSVYNLLGEEIQVLKNEVMEAGFYEVTFDASSLPSGVYMYKVETPNYTEAKKMMLTK